MTAVKIIGITIVVNVAIQEMRTVRNVLLIVTETIAVMIAVTVAMKSVLAVAILRNPKPLRLRLLSITFRLLL